MTTRLCQLTLEFLPINPHSWRRGGPSEMSSTAVDESTIGRVDGRDRLELASRLRIEDRAGMPAAGNIAVGPNLGRGVVEHHVRRSVVGVADLGDIDSMGLSGFLGRRRRTRRAWRWPRGGVEGGACDRFLQLSIVSLEVRE